MAAVDEETGASVQLFNPETGLPYLGDSVPGPTVYVDTPDSASFATLEVPPCTRPCDLARYGDEGVFRRGGGVRVAVPRRLITVLGRFKGGTEKYIGEPGYNALNLPSKGAGRWNWTRNKRFLDDAIERGDEIRLVTNPNARQFSGGNVFQRELRYLRDRGYRFLPQGDQWIALKP